jgi:hypothetical protein
MAEKVKNSPEAAAQKKVELREKLERLLRQEADVNKDKKANMKSYGDQLKEIRGEIKDVLTEIDELNAQ